MSAGTYSTVWMSCKIWSSSIASSSHSQKKWFRNADTSYHAGRDKIFTGTTCGRRLENFYMKTSQNMYFKTSQRSSWITFQTCISSRMLICPHLWWQVFKQSCLHRTLNPGLHHQVYNLRLQWLKKRSLLQLKTRSLHHFLTRYPLRSLTFSFLQHHKNLSLLHQRKNPSLPRHKNLSRLRLR